MERENSKDKNFKTVSSLKIRLFAERELSRKFHLQFTAYTYRRIVAQARMDLGMPTVSEIEGEKPKRLN